MNFLKLVRNSLIGLLSLAGCNSEIGIPKGASPVSPFETEKYLGKWYEIARMDFRFERNLNNTTAFYSLKENGLIRVENRGYNYVTEKWKKAIGKAKMLGEPNIASLKVSFFGPFYGGYHVIALDSEYKYALVAGESTDYLWILARETTIPELVKQEYLETAAALGFRINELVWVEHNAK